MALSIGLLGGTFNPIHIGHLRIAEELAENLKLNEIRFIPSANPPHKPAPQISAEHRSAMVQLAIENNPTFKLDTCELARASTAHTLERAVASYTIDTLISLRGILGHQTSLQLIMGSDAFTQLDTWYRWQELIQYTHIVLVQRPQPITPQKPLSHALEHFLRDHYTEDTAVLHDAPAGFIAMQTVTSLAISSTNIRERLNNKQSIRYLVPETVIDYIATHQLYCA